ncbi:MAG: hypothetical protein CFH10_01715 [Alphaproteobacteria bacterium MarineAlpha4_Bin2]|nr:MAG: hypothetical protein CFH10_01715 [Alphaproteobacteria bacterium MarineAlpha4_Bin2]
MSEPLQRNQIIELLTDLGKEKDEEVLLAARELHSRVKKSGLGWDDLLVGDQSEAKGEALDAKNECGVNAVHNETIEADKFLDDHPERIEQHSELEPSGLAEESVDETQTLSLIEKLLANDSFSSDLYAELEEYKTEIADGTFAPRDHHYVRALYARLTKT